MNGVQTRFKCKLDVKRCKRFVFPPSSLLPRSNALKTKAIRYFQTDRTLTRIVSPPLKGNDEANGKDIADLKQVVTQAAPEPEKVFDMVEQMPTFPGGQQELMAYLGKNIKYPTIAQENGTQGRVIIQFVVERDGSITDVRVARGVDPYLDKEAVRVVKSMPKWLPGKQNGKAVRVKFTVPVMFRLQ